MSAWQQSKTLCSLGITLAAAIATSKAYAANQIIYQAFDEHFAALEGKLDELKSLGYTALQVSPPAKSIDDPVWYGRYQPIDMTKIEGPLGTENDLRSLVAHAHAKGLKVLADVVLNHMADQRWVGGSLNYPQFDANDFHYPDGSRCINNYQDRYEVTHYWMCDENAHLPDLDTSSAKVRNVHKQYLQKLMGLGIDGFRFDAAKHIEPEYWADVLQSIPHDKYYYGEVIGDTLDESRAYTGMMPVTDFHLLRTMLSAFSLNGDLTFLIDPEAYGGALTAHESVAFARNHDTAMHSSFFNFGDATDASLANAYILGRGIGDVMIYRDDYADWTVRAGLAFNGSMREGEAAAPYVRHVEEVCPDQACNAKTTMFMERGRRGLMIINTADAWLDIVSARFAGLAPGCYRELSHDFSVTIARGGDGASWVSAWGSPSRGGVQVGPRTALFLVKQNDGTCNF